MTDDSADDQTATEAAAAGESSRVPGDQAEFPRPAGADNDRGAAAMTPAGSHPSPGESSSVPVPHDDAAPGTSETAEPVDGVRVPETQD